MAHTFTKLVYHCVFSTKGRARLITPDIRERLYAYIGGILREYGSTSLRAGGTEDHVHLLIELAATLPVADAMPQALSSRMRTVQVYCAPGLR